MAERWDRLRSIVERASELPATEREAFLDVECIGDADLREESAEWLAASVDEEPFLEPPERPAPRGELSAGDTVGSFRLTRTIASGGMGTVYEAEQEAPRRRVALKVMKAGPWSAASERRFRYEVEVLAALRHPGIAQVYETGIHSVGAEVPWFAMEFVEDAETIVEHARVRGLSVEERVRLFTSVCDAVRHGHRKGVIHRDLKPDNILVGRAGRPKVIDFGVARATGTELDARTIQTRTGEIVGTLSYMSPEQLGGDAAALDTRSDVYSLGVVLYELLCGELPYGSERRDLVATARLITEAPPRRPSRLVRETRGDLETILLKCLEKDPDRRYASADELGSDLRRWLDREPIAARPPSLLYTLSMLARRNRGAAIGFAATLVALVVGTIVSIGFALDADEQRLEADDQRLKADEGRRAAELGAYIASLAAADASLVAKQIGEARHRLYQAPEEYRSWEWHHLLRRSTQSRTTFTWKGHHAFAVAFHPDEPLLACLAMSGAGESSVRILSEGRVVREIGPDPGPTRAIAFCPGERVIVMGRPTGRIEFQSADTGETVRVLEGHTAAIRTLAFSNDGSRLVSGANDGTVRVWDWRNEEVVDERKLPSRIIVATEHAAVSQGGTVRAGDVTLEVGGPVSAAAVSPDGRFVAVAAPEFSVRLWDVRARSLVTSLAGHTASVQAIAFSADGRHLVSGSQDQTLRLWDVASRRGIATLLGHVSMVFGVAFEPGGARLASASANGETKIWDARPREPIPTLATDRAWTFALDPTGATMASGGIDGSLRLWNVATRHEVASLEGKYGIHGLAFDGRGERLAVGRENGVLQVVDVATRRELLSFDTGHGSVWATLFVADGARGRLVTSGDDGAIRVWNAADGTRLATWKGHGGRVRALAASPDGKRVASGSVDKTVRVWDLASGDPIAVLEGHEHQVISVVFSPDGKRVASGGFDIHIRVWDLATREEIQQFTGSLAVGFTADGRRLVGAGGTALRIWDVATARPVITLRGHRRIVIGGVMSADGSTVASLDRDIASDRRSTKLWETRGGTRMVTPE